MRRLLLLALAAVVAPSLGAQSVFDSELRFAPQFLSYQIKAPNDEKISELAIPVFVTIPFGSRFRRYRYVPEFLRICSPPTYRS